MKRTITTLAATVLATLMTGIAPLAVQAAQIGPGDFEDPMIFDFSGLPSGTHLGAGLANPYAGLSVEFTGYVTTYTGYGLEGLHLASGFANSPPEPFVVRIRFLHEPALRVGGNVWPEYESRTSITAYGEHGEIVDTFSVGLSSGWAFMGLEASKDSPIYCVEWRGLPGSDLTTFPRVDNVRVDMVPEPVTLSLLGIGGLVALIRRQRS